MSGLSFRHSHSVETTLNLTLINTVTTPWACGLSASHPQVTQIRGAVQRQTAVTAHLKSKQLLLFVFAVRGSATNCQRFMKWTGSSNQLRFRGWSASDWPRSHPSDWSRSGSRPMRTVGIGLVLLIKSSLKWRGWLNYKVHPQYILIAISTNQNPTIYRNLYENTSPGVYVTLW